MWHITYQCGLQCKFCFSPTKSACLDISKIENYIKQLKNLLVQKVDISGGEPLQYSSLNILCEALYQNKIFMTLTTRGIGLEKNIKWLIINREFFSRIIISLDVPESNLFNKLSGNDGLFINTKSLICNLKEKKYSNIRINTVVSKFLLEDEILMKMIQIISETGCCEWCLIEPHPANKKSTFDQVAVNINQFEEVVKKIKTHFLNKSTCKVLVRYLENYAGYWVLYPEGILAKHTENENDIMEMDFLNTSSDQVMKKVKENKIWMPEEN